MREKIFKFAAIMVVCYFIYESFVQYPYFTSATITLIISYNAIKNSLSEKMAKKKVAGDFEKYMSGEITGFAIEKFKGYSRNEKSEFIKLLSNEGSQADLIERLFMIEFLNFSKTKKDQHNNYIFPAKEYKSKLSDIFNNNQPNTERIKNILSQSHDNERLLLEEIKFHSKEEGKDIHLIKLRSCATNSSNTISLD